MRIKRKATMRLDKSDIEALAAECGRKGIDCIDIVTLLRRRVSHAGYWKIGRTSKGTFQPECNKGTGLELFNWMDIDIPEITEKQIEQVKILIGT